MKNLGTPYAIGYILAGVIGIPLVLYFANQLFFKHNDGEKHMHEYIANSEDLKVFIPEWSEENERGFEQYTAFLSKRGGKVNVDYIIIHSNEHKKYFSLRFINLNNFAQNVGYVIFDRSVIITVNKDDLKNPILGGKKNPILVFKVVGDGKPISINTTDANGKEIDISYDVTQKIYETNVLYHLTYIMPKDEFKERFESK